MAKFLLDYVFPISVIVPVPPASTGFLKQIVLVVKPKTGQTGNVDQIFECTTMVQVAARTDNTDAQQFFAAGMDRVFVLLADDLELADALNARPGDSFTVLISSDFDDDDLVDVTSPAVPATVKIQDILYTAKTPGVAGNAISIVYADTLNDGTASASVVGSAITVAIDSGATPASAIAAAIVASTPANALVGAVIDSGDEGDFQMVQSSTPLTGGAAETIAEGSIDVGGFDGVVGYASTDVDVCQTFAAQANRCAFFTSVSTRAKNMCYAFGKLLSNQASWKNQQYISMPFNDNVDTLGAANSLFDKKISFVLSDTEFGNRLAFFVAGGEAIAAPYIIKNLRLDVQSMSLTWISANQPDYTVVNASLLEDQLQTKVIDRKYIDTKLIEAGTITVSLIQENFVANSEINIAKPKALWKLSGQLMQTL